MKTIDTDEFNAAVAAVAAGATIYQHDSAHHVAPPVRWLELVRRLKSTVEMGGANGLTIFQGEVGDWVKATFTDADAVSVTERSHRFLEEALELVQSCGCTKGEANQLVEYVFNREVGERDQEVGGVLLTLSALCNSFELDMGHCGAVELRRVWARKDEIRAKNAAKPRGSALPGPSGNNSVDEPLPSTVMAIESFVVDTLLSLTNRHLDDISGETRIEEDLGLDSLDVVEAVIRIEQHFSTNISDDGLDGVFKVSDLIAITIGAVVDREPSPATTEGNGNG